MATKNIVPRADGEGGIGTSAKKWLNGFFKNITVQTEANVPTPANSDNSTKAATTAFVENTFFAKLVTKLAANTAASISSLNTSSLFYRMLSWALTASGVQYNFTNSSAWYICFGSLLGGLIIQGGTLAGLYPSGTFPTGTPSSVEIPLPVSFSTAYIPAVVPSTNDTGIYLKYPIILSTEGSSFSKVKYMYTSANTGFLGCRWLAIGK